MAVRDDTAAAKIRCIAAGNARCHAAPLPRVNHCSTHLAVLDGSEIIDDYSAKSRTGSRPLHVGSDKQMPHGSTTIDGIEETGSASVSNAVPVTIELTRKINLLVPVGAQVKVSSKMELPILLVDAV